MRQPAEILVPTFAGATSSVVTGAGRLFSWLQTQPLEGYERSFKLSAGRLLANRFLMGIPVERIAPPELLEICRELAMPDRFIERIKTELSGADTVHFGFEENNIGGIFKVYLEYWNQLNPARERGDDSILLHRAYKWDAFDRSRCMVADYRCFLRLSREQTLCRIAAIYEAETTHPSFVFTDRLVALACAQTEEKLMYLEVSEEQNPRISFDLNFHAAGLKLREIESQIMVMCRHYEVPAEQFALLWDGIGTKTLGHLSGGSSRDGEDFMTIYYDPLG